MVLQTMTHWVTYTYKDKGIMLKATRGRDFYARGTVEERLESVPLEKSVDEHVSVPVGEDVYTYVYDWLCSQAHRDRVIIKILEIDRLPVKEGAGQMFF